MLRMNKQGLPRYPEVSGQELKKTFVVRAPKPAENGKAPSTPSSSSSAAASSSADAFETPMSLDATEPRLLALGRRLLPGHGCHFAAWCAVSMRGQGGGLTAPDPHVSAREHAFTFSSCSFMFIHGCLGARSVFSRISLFMNKPVRFFVQSVRW